MKLMGPPSFMPIIAVMISKLRILRVSLHININALLNLFLHPNLFNVSIDVFLGNRSNALLKSTRKINKHRVRTASMDRELYMQGVPSGHQENSPHPHMLQPVMNTGVPMASYIYTASFVASAH